MRVVTVYRVDYARRTRNPIGVVLEKRETERLHNHHDLSVLAQRIYALDTADAVNIVIEVSQVVQPYLPKQKRSDHHLAIRKFVEGAIVGLILCGPDPQTNAPHGGAQRMPSLPCPTCGAVDDLETVIPTGTLMDMAVAWQCSCGDTRAVAITHRIPRGLLLRAMAAGACRSTTGGGDEKCSGP